MGAPRGSSGNNNDSSSGEEDGDAEWKAAIVDSLAATTTRFVAQKRDNNNHHLKNNVHGGSEEDYYYNPNSRPLKHYQVKAQKLLDDILEKELVVVKNPTNDLDEKPQENEGGIRLFKKAPLGIVLERTDELKGPTKKPRLVPGTDIDEKSKKFRKQLLSVAVDGSDIMAVARDASQKSLARLEAKDAAAKSAAKREEERVAELKRMRGERWLPSMARDMQLCK